ncbi:Triple functional domain protein [Colletotrichum tanaceti]|uniref:Triple functional domain protein n=1 Tax=Colletotrichum tanaceti TaxID=1306861 RepID=A0A4U6XK71_9PEZI|nr:Triple functional domain protein [Colletotrichum tanaceti]
MEFGHTTTRTRLAPQGSVNLNDLRLSVSQSRANFTRVRARAGRSTSNKGPKADFLTFVSLTCEIYQSQGDDLVPIQHYPSVLETYQGKGHTSLVTHAQVALAAPSNFSRGTMGWYSEGIVIKRPRHSILEERADGLNSFITELHIRSHAPLESHPNIARLRGVGWDFEDEDATIPRPILLEEFAPQGDLNNFWKNWTFVKMSFKAKLDFCRDIAEGLSVLHDCGVVHGDVKPENILVFPRHDARNTFMLKLTDFGHSVIESDTAETLPAFTPQWSAPEVTKMTSMTFQQMKATDYYSFGLVTLSIMLSRAFYTEVEEIENHKQNGTIFLELVGIVEREDRCNDDSDLEVGTIARLLSKTVQLNPEARSLRESMDIIDLYLVENQVTSSRVPVVHRPAVRVPSLDVISKVSVGYHTLINCSHHLKARIVTTLLELATKSNDPRNSAAQWELAICHFSGFGIPRDFEAASHWLTMARENGVAAAQEFFNPLQEAIVVAKGTRERDKSAGSGTRCQRNKTTSSQSERRPVANTTAATLESITSDANVPDKRASGSVKQGSIRYGLEPRVPGTAEWLRPTDDRTIDPKQKSTASLQRYLQDGDGNEDPTRSVPTSMTSALQEAIKSGSVDQLQGIIANDPNSISSVDESGNTPLLLAAHHGQPEVFRYLLGRENPRTSVYNKSGQTALHLLTKFDDKHVQEFAVLLVKRGADILHEALPVCNDEETLIFSLGLRCCPMLNSILHNRTALLGSLLEAAHGDPSSPVCQICEAGSRFRRILAVCLSLFRIDASEMLRNHLKTHGGVQTIDLANVQVWTGQNLVRVPQVPFKSVAVSTMDLPEDFFRAMLYGGTYGEVLERTIDFVTNAEDPMSASRSSTEMDTLKAAIAGNSLDAVNYMLCKTTAKQQALPLWLLSPGCDMSSTDYSATIFRSSEAKFNSRAEKRVATKTLTGGSKSIYGSKADPQGYSVPKATPTTSPL